MARLRLATVWLGGCSGCHMSFLDLDEFLFEVAEAVELVYSPLADGKEYPSGVDLCLIEGAVCNEDNLELARRIRARTRLVVSFGDCAVTGNVPALRNVLGAGNAADVLQCAYVEHAAPGGVVPPPDGIVPALLPRVLPLHAVIPVDHYLPGCPPSASRIKAFLAPLLAGGAPRLEGEQLKFG